MSKEPVNLEFLKKEMEKVLEVQPKLTDIGLYFIPTGYKITMKPEEMLSDEILKQFSLCREWLSKVDRTETFNTNQGSYSYKHMVEGCFRRYVCNGAFIAAAISLGIPIQRCRLNDPSVYLKISQESVNEMIKYTNYDRNVID